MITAMELMLILITWGIPTGNIKIDDNSYYVPDKKELKAIINFNRKMNAARGLGTYDPVYNDCDSFSARLDVDAESFNKIMETGAQDVTVGKACYIKKKTKAKHSAGMAVINDKGDYKPVFIEYNGFIIDMEPCEISTINWSEF